MRNRFGLLIAVITFAVGLTACGGGGTIVKDGASSASETTVDDGTTDSTETTDDTVAEGDDPAVDVPDLGDMGDGSLGPCIELTGALSSMASAMSGEELPPGAQAQIDAAMADLPDDVKADFELLVEGYTKFGEGDIAAAGEIMGSPEFEEATNRMTEYIEQVCAG